MTDRRALGKRAHVLATALAALIAIAVGLAAYLTRAWSPWEGDSVDLRFTLRDPKPPTDVAVVAIDEATFSELGRQWPFPRSVHARAIDRLRRAGARTIAYDVQFTEPTVAREDNALYRAVARTRRVVLATTEVDERGRTNVLGGDANVARAHSRVAASNMPADRGGVLRRFHFEESGLKTLAVAAAELTTGREAPRARFERDGAWIDYRGPPGTVPTVSFSRLLRGDVDAGLLRGRAVVVGASAPTLQDIHPTPVSKEKPMSGPEVQANAIWSAMHGLPLRSAPALLDLLAIVLMGLAAPLAGLRLKGFRLALVLGVLVPAYGVASQLVFASGTILALTYPIASLLVGTVATGIAGYLTESRERRRVSRYSELLEGEVRKRTEELRETQLEVVRRLGQAAESRDEETGRHIERIGRMCHRLGLAAGMDVAEAELLRDASAMHDLGKIGIPDSILRKPGEFTAEEREIMKTHTLIGAQILAGSRSRLVQVAHQIALTHHERWDGSGYPAGLRGEEIPLAGRICAICDVFDALTSQRIYKPGWSFEQTLAEIRAQSGRAFDPRLVELFRECAAGLFSRSRDALGEEERAAGRVSISPAPGPSAPESDSAGERGGRAIGPMSE